MPSSGVDVASQEERDVVEVAAAAAVEVEAAVEVAAATVVEAAADLEGGSRGGSAAGLRAGEDLPLER